MKSENKKNNRSKTGHLGKKFMREMSGWVLVVPTVLCFLILVWRPIVIGITYSFFKLKGFTPTEFVGLKNFIDVLSDTNFLQTLLNTVKYVLWSLLVGLPLPFIAAVLLNEMRHLKGFFKFSLYLPVVLPSVLVCIIWRFVYMDGSSGLLNMILNFFGFGSMSWLSNKGLGIPLIIVAMSWNAFGGTMILYLASMQSVDNSLYEAARLDGAGFFRRCTTVLFPHMRGTILLLAIRQIIGVFQVTEQPMVMTGGGPNGATMSLGLTNYYYAFKYNQMDKSLAMGTIMFLLLIGFTFLYFKLDKKINE